MDSWTMRWYIAYCFAVTVHQILVFKVFKSLKVVQVKFSIFLNRLVFVMSLYMSNLLYNFHSGLLQLAHKVDA